MSQKTRKVFNIEEKSHIIRRLLNGESNTKIAKDCRVSHSTISTIWKNREKIKALFENNSLKMKRSRTSEHKEMEEALLTWFKHQRANNVPISGPILQQKANHFARLMGKDNFECSSSWIHRFRIRHNIVSGKVCGEAAGVPEQVAEEWLSHKWPALCEGYTPEQIFNADETGLFFNLTLDKALKFKGEQCKDGQLSETRITVLVVANMTGSYKKKLLVIGKAKKPRCFKNIHSLPVTYENNAKSWMTSLIFEKWMRNWDAELKSRGNKILLLVDNCPAHPVVSNLQCIKLVFFPPSVTSVLQPMDQGVIKALKSQYRKLQVLQMLHNIENGEDIKSLGILDAILLISEAWEKVTQTTIANCFHRAGFKDLSPLQAGEDNNDDIPLVRMIQHPTNEDDDVPLAQLVAQLHRSTTTETKIEIEEFIGIDDDIAVCAIATEEEIIAEAESNNHNTDEVNEDQQDHQEQFQPTTICEALSAITVLQKFVAFNDQFDTDDTLMNIKRKMLNIFETQLKEKQTKITDFFKKDPDANNEDILFEAPIEDPISTAKPKKIKKKKRRRSSTESEQHQEDVEVAVYPEIGDEGESDRLFLMSFLPEMRQLPLNIKMWARTQIANVMQEAVTSHYNSLTPANETRPLEIKRQRDSSSD